MTNQLRSPQGGGQTSFELGGIRALLWLLFLGAVGGVFWNFQNGPTTLLLAGTEIQGIALSIGLRIDILSSIMLTMITLLGACIAQYSVRYLAGESRQTYFFRYLLLAVVSTSMLVASSNLVLFFLSWLASSLFLHQLLVYYKERPEAVNAARKKFAISRIGDLSLLLAIGFTYQIFGTFEFEELFRSASAVAAGSDQDFRLGIIGFLFALGAMAKSAQFPFHFWLPETMEAPTPVSALMHAGIINAGGFLIIRLSPILEHSASAHILLALVGAFTAVFAALVMITQNHLKAKLAYSTISQMGMMLFACGLGLYSFALFHILAHSFYKAYAFLSTGQQVEESRKTILPHERPSGLYLGTVTAIGLGTLCFGLLFEKGFYLPYFTYSAILFLGLSQNFGGLSLRTFTSLVGSKIGLILAGSVALFVMIEVQISHFLSSLVPSIHSSLDWNAPQALMCGFSYLVFACGLWLTAYLPYAESTLMKRVYSYFWNGGYFSAYSSRYLESFYGKSQVSIANQSQFSETEHANA